MGYLACELIAKFLSRETKTHTLIRPFCGEGTMLAMANKYGINAIGIERSPKRAEKAKKIIVNSDKNQFDVPSTARGFIALLSVLFL